MLEIFIAVTLVAMTISKVYDEYTGFDKPVDLVKLNGVVRYG